MSGIFGKQPDMPAPPKPVRMPTETDPEVLQAGFRARETALRRTGRLSTLLTDNTRDVSGTPPPYSRTTIG